MYSGLLQKIHQKKAVIRLNLLRIVRSIVDGAASETEYGVQQVFDIRGHPLFEAVEALVERDAAVLVRNMAADLVKTVNYTSSRDSDVGSGGRRERGTGARRQSSYPSPNLLGLGVGGVSTPNTPTHNRSGLNIGASFLDGGSGMTPRRSGLAVNLVVGGDHDALYRPRSRDGQGLPVRRTSSEYVGNGGSRDVSASSSVSSLLGTPVAKSRLPRTSLRPSRSSLAPKSSGMREEYGQERVQPVFERRRSVLPSPAPVVHQHPGSGSGGHPPVSMSIGAAAGECKSRVRSDPSHGHGGGGKVTQTVGGAGGGRVRRGRAPSGVGDIKWS
jgi:hypothetical protein